MYLSFATFLSTFYLFSSIFARFSFLFPHFFSTFHPFNPLFPSVLALCNHFIWFYYFSSSYYRFVEIVSFFSLCVWLIPFSYFVSLSANEHTLPSDSLGSGGNVGGKRGAVGNRLLVLFNFLRRKKEEILPSTAGVGGQYHVDDKLY